MTLFKILLIVLFCCVLPVVIVLKIWAHFVALHTEKKWFEKTKIIIISSNKNSSWTFKSFETEAQKPKEYYLKTYYITTELHFNDMCLIQRENNWLVCYADWHSFTDEHYFQTEQKACEFFFHYYFLL